MAPNTDNTNNTDSNDETKEPQPRFARLREAWSDAWAEYGFLRNRWEEIRSAPAAGWHGMAVWIKVFLALVSAAASLFLVIVAIEVAFGLAERAIAAAPDLNANSRTGLWAIVDNPVRDYIQGHSNQLPISATTVYALWQTTGLVAGVGAFLVRSNGLRASWIIWGAATIAMVWIATPGPSRPLAAGIAVLAWSLASTLALREISLVPRVFTTVHNHHTTSPQIHIPAQQNPTPNNVHPINH
ncbi:hypothetical protein [Streptomyces sp. SM12]|uniref:hypothetical protein n=1 Tax=Streptomyces sp. SM12 TaxID=1071602 RepID=UPI000CD558D5|nr:hypothetical protein [Streptomyces sp. SM12]